jgi:signal transduction histidine kinase
MAEVGSVLASSLELEFTLASVGQLATRTFADFCMVYLVEEGGEIRRLKVVSRSRDKDWVCEALMQMPLNRSRARDVWSELNTNRSVLVTHASPELIMASAQSDEHLRALRGLDPKSIIVAPVFARGELLGALSFVSSEPDRVYSRADVRFAEEIARRAAYAIDNAQLYSASRRATESRDAMLGIVAHDLRNPLTTILMRASRLRRLDPNEESRLVADTIERSGWRMNRIIQDLLDVNQIEQGRLSIAQDRVSTRDAVSESVEAQRPLATAASLELRLELAQNLPDVWADRDRLLQIFENLIGNAVKFTGPGGIIRVGTETRPREVLFWVADTGAGISAETLPHIFDRYWQARRTDRRGLGLGLAVVKGLVEAHGGRIWVESALNRGTTVFFTIPTSGRRAPADRVSQAVVTALHAIG